MQKTAKKADIFLKRGFLKVVYPQPMIWDKISKVVKSSIRFMDKKDKFDVCFKLSE